MSNQLALYGKQVLQMLNCAVRRKSNRSPPNLFFNSMQHSQFDLKLSYNLISDPRFSRASGSLCILSPLYLSQDLLGQGSAIHHAEITITVLSKYSSFLFLLIIFPFSLFLSRTLSARDIHSS